MRHTSTALLTLAAACALAAPAQGAVVNGTPGGQLRFDAQPGEANKVEVAFRPSGAAGNVGEGDRIVLRDTRARVIPVGTGDECIPFDLTESSGAVSCRAAAYSSVALAMGDLDDTVVVESEGDKALPAAYPVVVRGFEGNDVLKSGLGDDVLQGDAGRDVFSGGAGDDRLLGGKGSDGLIGDVGDDELFGGPGNDALFGQGGADFFRGGAGNDVLVARDRERDRSIDCGPGGNQKASFDAKDPKPRSCEEREPRKRAKKKRA